MKINSSFGSNLTKFMGIFLVFFLAFFTSDVQSDEVPDPSERPAILPELEDVITDAQLLALQDALWCINMDEKDLTFNKRPIDDPFRLSIVNLVLDEPLETAYQAHDINVSYRELIASGDYDELVAKLGGLTDVKTDADCAQFEYDLHKFAKDNLTNAEATNFLKSVDNLNAGLKTVLAVLLNSIVKAEKCLDKAFAAFDSETYEKLRIFTQSRAVEGNLETFNDAELPEYQTIEEFLADLQKIDRTEILKAAIMSTKAAMFARRQLKAMLQAYPDSNFGIKFDSQGIFRLNTPWGLIVLSNQQNNVLTDDMPVIHIDLGGDDTYRGRVGTGIKLADEKTEISPIAYHFDLAGDDYYAGNKNFNCGAGYFGVGISIDESGDDIRKMSNLSGGAGLLGLGLLIDENGKDIYVSDVSAQGAGVFGWGILCDIHGDDRFDVNLFGQGFAYVWAAGLLYDGEGDDVYNAGGEYVHYPLFNDRFQALSQGFSIGMRPHASGGVGILIDECGNDTYKSDIYGQGSSYWYSYGVLCDNSGNDYYTMSQYGQGSGIHLAAGALLDYAGNDIYYNPFGVGIGGCHDYAVGILVDKKGFDYYAGCGLSQGTGGTNGVGFLIEGEGDDVYAVQQRGIGNSTIGGGRPARGYGSIGTLLDCGGKDVYSDGIARNNFISTKPSYGTTFDFEMKESKYPEQAKLGILTQAKDAENKSAVEAVNKAIYLAQENVKHAQKLFDAKQYLDCMNFIDATFNQVIKMLPKNRTSEELKNIFNGMTKLRQQALAEYKKLLPEVKLDLEPEMLEKLEKLWSKGCEWAVGDNSVLVRKAWDDLAEIGEPAMRFLLTKMDTYGNGLDLVCLQSVFKQWGDKSGEALVKKLDDPDLVVKSNAMVILSDIKYKSDKALEKYFEFADDERMQSRAISVLRSLRIDEAVPVFIKCIQGSRSTYSRVNALAALAELKSVTGLDAMFSVLNEEELFSIRHTSEEQIVKIDDEEVSAKATKLAMNAEANIKSRLHGVSILGQMKREKDLKTLYKLTADKDWRVAGFALLALNKYRGTAVWSQIQQEVTKLLTTIDMEHLFVKSSLTLVLE